MAWGIRTNAIYTAQNYIYHWGACVRALGRGGVA